MVLERLASGKYTYEFFHGPGLGHATGPPAVGARSQGLADESSTHDMSHMVQSITYGDLWGNGAKKGASAHHGPPSWLKTAYEGLAHFH
mmetsp:Transcript_14570/g.33666  ORF Transcript_14570/g.33666 Transcript_14570/m.33666 type:complete len:89 (-) Transcript_14570:368-634(-)